MQHASVGGHGDVESRHTHEQQGQDHHQHAASHADDASNDGSTPAAKHHCSACVSCCVGLALPSSAPVVFAPSEATLHVAARGAADPGLPDQRARTPASIAPRLSRTRHGECRDRPRPRPDDAPVHARTTWSPSLGAGARRPAGSRLAAGHCNGPGPNARRRRQSRSAESADRGAGTPARLGAGDLPTDRRAPSSWLEGGERHGVAHRRLARLCARGGPTPPTGRLPARGRDHDAAGVAPLAGAAGRRAVAGRLRQLQPRRRLSARWSRRPRTGWARSSCWPRPTPTWPPSISA